MSNREQPTPLTDLQSAAQDVMLSILDDNPQVALNELSSLVEACLWAIGESLEDFVARVQGWKEARDDASMQQPS